MEYKKICKRKYEKKFKKNSNRKSDRESDREYSKNIRVGIITEVFLLALFLGVKVWNPTWNQKNELKEAAAISAGLTEKKIGRTVAEIVSDETTEPTTDTSSEQTTESTLESASDEDYIKWVDFNVSYEALCLAYEADVNTYESANASGNHADEKNIDENNVHIEWIPLLAYTAARSGGEFGSEQLRDMDETITKLTTGEEELEQLASELKYYPYYLEAYQTVLGDYVGEYELVEDGTEAVKQYGLKAFSPIAKGFPYNDYDDFGVSRSFGYRREHLGHDMLGQIGTPIISVASGYVEAMGWNKYGGWRIGIRSFDKKRYYYYAHLRQNYPYAEGLEVGDTVTAGDVIGYMGHTGYSDEENVNNIDSVHLHFGLQLIFDESQKEGNGEIWVDCYALTRFLRKNSSQVEKVGESKEWKRSVQMRDLGCEQQRLEYENEQKKQADTALE